MVSPKRQTKRTVSRGYYSTPAWRALALACKARDGERCRRCGKGRTKRRRLHAHHVIPRSKGGADHLDNLITLCATCHKEEHPRMQRRKRTPKATKPKNVPSPAQSNCENSGESSHFTEESSVP